MERCPAPSSPDSPPLETPVYLPLRRPDELDNRCAAALPAALLPPNTKGCQFGNAPLQRCREITTALATAPFSFTCDKAS